MKAKIITLGCKVNQYESEAMLEALLAGGFQEARSGEEADVVVVNSCTVTATSDQICWKPMWCWEMLGEGICCPG